MAYQEEQGKLAARYLKIFFREMNLTGLVGLLDEYKTREIANKIYSESGLYLDEKEVSVTRENKTIKQSLCPYCQTSIEIGAETVYCNSCHLPYHRDCWRENSGCAAVGCKSKKMNISNNRSGAYGFIDLTTEEMPETSVVSTNDGADSQLEGDRMTNTSTTETLFILKTVIITLIIIMIILLFSV